MILYQVNQRPPNDSSLHWAFLACSVHDKVSLVIRRGDCETNWVQWDWRDVEKRLRQQKQSRYDSSLIWSTLAIRRQMKPRLHALTCLSWAKSLPNGSISYWQTSVNRVTQFDFVPNEDALFWENTFFFFFFKV